MVVMDISSLAQVPTCEILSISKSYARSLRRLIFDVNTFVYDQMSSCFYTEDARFTFKSIFVGMKSFVLFQSTFVPETVGAKLTVEGLLSGMK